MYDSVTAADIPRGALMVAYYVDGAYAWSAADLALHAHAKQVAITVTGATLDADVADVENGDLTAAQGAAWLKRKHAAGQIGSLYFSLSRVQEVEAAIKAVGLVTGQWQAWIADWNGVYGPVAGSVAHQYANPTLSHGHYDLSWVEDYWPGVDAAPATPPPAPPPAPPPPTPPPAPAPASNLDQARAAWARLGELLITDFPGAVESVTAAITKIQKLP